MVGKIQLFFSERAFVTNWTSVFTCMGIQQWLVGWSRNKKIRKPYNHFCSKLFTFPWMKPDLDPSAHSFDCKGTAAQNLAVLFGNNAKYSGSSCCAAAVQWHCSHACQYLFWVHKRCWIDIHASALTHHSGLLAVFFLVFFFCCCQIAILSILQTGASVWALCFRSLRSVKCRRQ